MEHTAGQSSAESTLKELHAYAKLLYLRSGRQFEEKTSYQEVEDDISPYEAGSDCDSAKNIPLSDFDLDCLRRNFLNRLSEIVSSRKGGRDVVASRMFYWSDKVKVFVAINSGFVEGDSLSKFLSNLCATLKEIAVAPDSQTVEQKTDTLWRMLLSHQSSRLNGIIVDLRQIMKSFQHLLPRSPSTELTGVSFLLDTGSLFEDWLGQLANLLFGDSDSDLEKHGCLVGFSHAMYHTVPAERFQILGRRGDELRQAIGLLSRLQTSFHVFLKAARQIDGFDNLFLIPVDRPKTQKKPPSQEWSLSQTFRALNRPLNDAEISKLMVLSGSKARWTKSKLHDKFSQLKSPTWEVHAEIQLILLILHHPEEVANGKGFDYIGCSRYSCLLCSKFLDHFQALKSRGCHGKLYNHSWTILPGESLGKGEQQMLSGAVMKLTSWMRKELVGSVKSSTKKKMEVRESMMGDSSIAIPGIGQESRQLSYAASEHLYRQRAENSQMQYKQERRLDLVEDEDVSSIQTRDETPAENVVKLCASCFGIETTRRCSRCGVAPFCDAASESNMPLSQLLKCNMRQVTSADYLNDDVLMNELPTDPQVQHDYWFDRCQNKDEESHLMGVFGGLLKYHPDPITREELHRWRSHSGGNPHLVAEIVKKFEELPNGNRGSYFPWFQRHRTRFELPDGHPSIPQALCHGAKFEEWQGSAWKYLAPEDQRMDIEDLDPLAKVNCFLFYSIVVGNKYPSPRNSENDYWFDFGFVVCNEQYEERRLGLMYNGMLFGSKSIEDYRRSLGPPILMKRAKKEGPTCSFDEFWRAWKKGELMAIFNKYRPEFSTENATMLATEHDLLTRLRLFLACERARRPSIWRLRHFLALENASIESAAYEIAQGARDYGFSEQLDTRTIMELREFYANLFKRVNPLRIHQERMNGNLLPFVRGHIDVVTPGVEAVLQGLL